MATSFSQTYVSPEHAETAYLTASAKLLPTSRGSYEVGLTRVKSDNLWAAQAHESGARIKHAHQTRDRAIVRFLVKPGPEVVSHGVTVPFGSVIRHSSADDYTDSTSDPTSWGILSLPVDVLAAASVVVANSDLSPPPVSTVVAPPASTMRRLLKLHTAAIALAETDPTILSHPEPARALEDLLTEAMVNCLCEPEAHPRAVAPQHHTLIMRRFRTVLEDNPDRPLHISEVCAIISVPERTLRSACQEQIGMSPKQYLTLRRMHMACRHLRAVAPETTTVSDVALQYGFWHFGRFSQTYRILFGESPSDTLRSSS